VGTLLATGTIAGFAAVAAPSAHAAFPGTNGPVVTVDLSANIDTIDPSTGVATQICSFATCGNVTVDRPETSPNGQTVVFVNGAGIATVPITGGGFTQITSDNGFDPSYTADGSTIVYQVGNTLRRVAATGGSSTTISGAPPGCADEPEVSPNGATVAYINFCATGFNLETIPIGGGLPNVVVANTGNRNDQVSWSPNGAQIALVDPNHCGTTPVGVVSATANNGAPTCLPNSTTGDSDPSFSSDGTKLSVSNVGFRLAVLNVNGIGRTDFTTSTTLDENYWAPATSTSGSTTTTSTTPPPTCVGTLTGSAFKGANPKPKKALAGVTVVATPTLSGTAASATTNAAGSYSMSVPCGTYTKTSTGPDTKTRVCHFGSKSGPTTATATVTNGSVDIENLFCKKK